ncbi:MAG: hypothetical protein WBN23_01935 [Woeseia sp.]
MFQRLRKASSTRGRAAVTWHGDRAALARVSETDSNRPLVAAALHNVEQRGFGHNVFSGIELGGEALGRSPVSTVLADGSYQMLLEELPNAPANEMREAIGWRIRDRIDTPLEEAVIELLEMPQHARATRANSAYAVVARRDDVQTQIEKIKAVGLKLDTIDLPELCMRNIAIRLPQDAEGVAFLHFMDDSGLLTITRQGVLYLVRRIDIGKLQMDVTPTTQLRQGLIPSICLELQRSLDYYETHYDLPSITSLVLAPGSALAPLMKAIREQLGLEVSRLDLADIFELETALDEETQKDCLLAVGASLRALTPAEWK